MTTKPRTICYVPVQCCTPGRPILPVGTLAHRHSDYEPWLHGKRETLALIESAPERPSRTWRLAIRVADFMGWVLGGAA